MTPVKYYIAISDMQENMISQTLLSETSGFIPGNKHLSSAQQAFEFIGLACCLSSKSLNIFSQTT